MAKICYTGLFKFRGDIRCEYYILLFLDKQQVFVKHFVARETKTQKVALVGLTCNSA
jgi:hypothetical protein